MHSSDKPFTSERIGKVTLEANGNTLRIRCSSNGQRYTHAVGRVDRPKDIKLGRQIAEKIDHAIKAGQFSSAWQGLKGESTTVPPLKVVKDKPPQVDLLDIWDQHVEHKKMAVNSKNRVGLKGKTLEEYDNLRQILVKLGDDLCFEPLRFRTKLLEVTTHDQARRVIQYLSAACDFGNRYGLCTTNPFSEMRQDFTRKRAEDHGKGANAFTQEEKERIIEAFRTDRYYQTYTNLVSFWFMTGCRPSEGLSLHWGDVSPDCDKVTFRGSYQKVKDPETGHYVFKWQDASKNNKVRTIPLTSACQQLLLSIRPDNPSDDALVFSSPRNAEIIDYQNANRADGWWRKVVDPIKQGTTPYNCRDTFITEQIMKGDSDTIIGRYCDTSPGMINKSYRDDKHLEKIRLTE